MKRIKVFSLGGTITYMGGEKSDLKGEELVQSLPEITGIANVTATSFLQISSATLTFDNVIALANEIVKTLSDESDGIVVSMGTDTLEETAFMLDLLLDCDAPIVVTGAMRNPAQLGADGPINLLAAIQVAASEEAKGVGVVVVLNDEIHSARFVRKTHTQNVAAFRSECGPIGWIAEGIPHLVMKPINDRRFTLQPEGEDIPVALYTVSFGDDGRLLTKIKDVGYKGLVVEAFGGGHVSYSMDDLLKQLAVDMPVVLASRVGSGETLTKTYRGNPGSETSLLSHGLISSGRLDGRKAKILLSLLLKSGKTIPEVKEIFSFYSKAIART